jgi:7-cyano-7-deazaguanine reductase
MPRERCLELKSFKEYLFCYRNLGIFQENVVNRFLRDVVAACNPMSATVVGEFTPRGGVFSKITATWSKHRAAPRKQRS